MQTQASPGKMRIIDKDTNKVLMEVNGSIEVQSNRSFGESVSHIDFQTDFSKKDKKTLVMDCNYLNKERNEYRFQCRRLEEQVRSLSTELTLEKRKVASLTSIVFSSYKNTTELLTTLGLK